MEAVVGSVGAGAGLTIGAPVSEAGIAVGAIALSETISSKVTGAGALSSETVASTALIVATAVSEVVTGTSGGY